VDCIHGIQKRSDWNRKIFDFGNYNTIVLLKDVERQCFTLEEVKPREVIAI